MRTLAALCFLLNTFLWATFYSVSKEALVRIDPIIFSALEVGILTPIAAGIIFLTRKDVNKESVKRGFFLGTVLSLAVFTTTVALKYTTATNTAFFPSMNGFMAALIAWAILGRPVSRSTWLAGAVSGTGALLLVFGSVANERWTGDLIAFLGALFYTCYIFRVDVETRENDVSPWPLFGIELLTMSFWTTLAAVIFGNWQAVHPIFPKDIIVVSYIGLATTFLPTAISIFMQKYIPPVTVAFIYILEPVFGALVAAIYLNELLNARGYLGGALIVAGAVINIWCSHRELAPNVNATA